MQFQFPECQKIDLSTIVTRASLPGMHLLKELLYWDSDKRPTAQQSLKYLFFQVIPLPSQHIVYKSTTEQKYNFQPSDNDNSKSDFPKSSLFAINDAQKRIQQKQLMLENNIFNFSQNDSNNLESNKFLSEDSVLVSANVDENHVNGVSKAVVAENSAVVGEDVPDNGMNPKINSGQMNTSSTNFNSIEPRPRNDSVDKSDLNDSILNIFQRANNNDSGQHMKKANARAILLDEYVPATINTINTVNNRNNFLNESLKNLINSQSNAVSYGDSLTSHSNSVSNSGNTAANSNRRFSVRRPSRLAEDNDSFREKISDIYINRNVSGIYPNGGTMKKNDLFERLPLSQNIGFFLHNEGSGVSNRSGVRRGDVNVFQQREQQRPVAERECGYLEMKLQGGSVRSSQQQPVQEVKRSTLDSWGAIDEDDKLARILG